MSKGKKKVRRVRFYCYCCSEETSMLWHVGDEVWYLCKDCASEEHLTKEGILDEANET